MPFVWPGGSASLAEAERVLKNKAKSLLRSIGVSMYRV